MKNVMNIALAAAVVAGSVVVASPGAFASTKHHQQEQVACVDPNVVVPLLFVGAAVGAVTGGVGAAVIWGSAYAVGGAAVGGATGLLVGTAHAHDHCRW